MEKMLHANIKSTFTFDAIHFHLTFAIHITKDNTCKLTRFYDLKTGFQKRKFQPRPVENNKVRVGREID